MRTMANAILAGLLLVATGCTVAQERNTVLGGTIGAGVGAIAGGGGGAVAGALIGGGTGYLATDDPRPRYEGTSYQRRR